MGYAALIVVLVALSATSTHQLNMSDLWTIPGSVKILESCLGKNMTDILVKNAFDAWDKCNNNSSYGNFTPSKASIESGNWDKLFDEFAANVTSHNGNSKHSNSNSPDSSGHNTDQNANTTNSSDNSTNSSDNSTNSSDNSTNSSNNSTNQNTNTTDSSDNSTNSSDNNTNNSGNHADHSGNHADHSFNNPELYTPLVEKLRCAFEEMGVTKNNVVDIDGTVKAYESVDIPQQLKAEIVASVKQCYELSLCFPLDQTAESRIPKDLLQLKAFVDCERYLRNWVCLKSYVKNDVKACEVDFLRSDEIFNIPSEDEASTTVIPVFD